jgi:hypothetical protein
MKRWLGNLVCLLSLLICAACVLFAIRAASTSDFVGWAGWRSKAAYRWHGLGIQSIRYRLTLYYFAGNITVRDPHNGSWNPDDGLGGEGPTARGRLYWTVRGPQQVAAPPGTRWWQHLGFGASHFPTRKGQWHNDYYSIGFHPWIIALVSAPPPFVWLRGWFERRRRARRVERGLCVGCGYDLRASADRCPECGRPFTRAS